MRYVHSIFIKKKNHTTGDVKIRIVTKLLTEDVRIYVILNSESVQKFIYPYLS